MICCRSFLNFHQSRYIRTKVIKTVDLLNANVMHQKFFQLSEVVHFFLKRFESVFRIVLHETDKRQFCINSPFVAGIFWLNLSESCILFAGNRLQLDAPVYLQGKKKLPGKKITGFEVVKFYPYYFCHMHVSFSLHFLTGEDLHIVVHFLVLSF